jgi:urocanate hydratase
MASTTNTLHVSRSAERAMHLLDAVVSHGRLPLAEAARLLDLPASTALRHLRALEQNGFVTRDGDNLYSAGPTFVRLALVALAEGPTARLIAVARTHLDKLADQTGESAYLAVRDGSEVLYVATAEGTHAIRHVGWVGRSVPLAGTAVGSALLTPPDPTRPTVPHVNTGAAEPDITAVAAGVTGVAGTRVAALSVLGPSHRLEGSDRAAVETAVVAAADALSIDLGRPVPGPS